MAELTEWCRIVKTERATVLFYQELDTSEPNDMDCVHQIVDYRDIRADLKVLFEEEMTQEKFDIIATIENANAVINEVEHFVNKVGEPTA